MHEGAFGLREGDAVDLGERSPERDPGAAGEGDDPLFEDDGPLERARRASRRARIGSRSDASASAA
jgi:hypothetical protein